MFGRPEALLARTLHIALGTHRLGNFLAFNKFVFLELAGHASHLQGESRYVDYAGGPYTGITSSRDLDDPGGRSGQCAGGD